MFEQGMWMPEKEKRIKVATSCKPIYFMHAYDLSSFKTKIMIAAKTAYRNYATFRQKQV